ncbi:MAG: PD-(D/E)XK nuclease family protein [Clostridiales bacterium]|nr:PD-(D/E)XK nuclease family protein [Clostridiales bacterium]
MELKFVLGKSSKTKTEYCIDKMIGLPQTKKVIYIVPEQFTLESEKALTLKRKSLLNIDVVSFRRFYFHITSQLGKPDREFLDDEGKNMILRRIISELKPDFFSKSYEKPGFLDSMEGIISEFYRFRLSPDTLKENISKIDETPENSDFIKKISEIAEIYSAYDKFTADKYISSDGILDYTAEKIKETDILDNCEVFIDGFNSFTAQEYGVISEIFAYAENVTITLCLEKPVEIFASDDALADPFYETKNAYVKLCGIFKELYPIGGTIKNIITEEIKENATALDFLERNFFEFDTPVYGKTDDVRVVSAVNKKAEIDLLCDEICSLAESGIRYREMGIILCDPSYGPVLRSGLKSRGIPDFSDGRTALISHPLSRFLLSLINMAAYTYRNDDVFTFLKTGFTHIKPYKVERLEKYVMEYGIEGYRWERELKDPYFEEIRQELIKMVKPLRAFSPQKAYLFSEFNSALFEAVELSGFYGKYAKAIEESDDDVTASRYKQLWAQAVSTFNKAQEFLGESEVTLEEYSGIISSGFEKKSVATIPLYQDNILIGDVERSRLPDLKVLFVPGANKENLPRKFEDTGLINDRERAILKEYGMEIAADTKERLSLEYLKIYQILTKPSKRLYLSYSIGTNTGEKLEKSEIADKLVTMFEIEPAVYEEKIISPENKVPFEPKECISPDIMDLFIKDELTLSSSRLDSYVKCPFSYFLNYILRLKEEKLFEINSLDKGNIMHGVMERFFKETENIYNLTEEDIIRIVGEIMPDVVAESLYNIVDEEKRIPEDLYKLKYFINRMEKTADTSIFVGIKQLKRGKFTPAEFEVSFGSREEDTLPPVKLTDNMSLTGKIDRVDIYEEGDDIYIKITDYKSSKQTLKFDEIYNGLKLQLLLYLSAYTEEMQKAAENKKTYHPAGLMYFSFLNPKLNEDKAEGKSAEDVKLGEFMPVGIISKEAKYAIDDESSKFAYTKGLEKVSEDEFKLLMDTARKISVETGEKIKSGSFPVMPYMYSGRHGCDYCPYSGICKIDIDKTRVNKIKEAF